MVASRHPCLRECDFLGKASGQGALVCMSPAMKALQSWRAFGDLFEDTSDQVTALVVRELRVALCFPSAVTGIVCSQDFVKLAAPIASNQLTYIRTNPPTHERTHTNTILPTNPLSSS